LVPAEQPGCHGIRHPAPTQSCTSDSHALCGPSLNDDAYRILDTWVVPVRRPRGRPRKTSSVDDGVVGAAAAFRRRLQPLVQMVVARYRQDHLDAQRLRRELSRLVLRCDCETDVARELDALTRLVRKRRPPRDVLNRLVRLRFPVLTLHDICRLNGRR
jgi:hypothetical protein